MKRVFLKMMFLCLFISLILLSSNAFASNPNVTIDFSQITEQNFSPRIGWLHDHYDSDVHPSFYMNDYQAEVAKDLNTKVWRIINPQKETYIQIAKAGNPLVENNFLTPLSLFNNIGHGGYGPPAGNDYTALREYVRDRVEYLERIGNNSNVYAFGNEPSEYTGGTNYGFWSGSQAQWVDSYKAIYRGVTDYDPNAFFGGGEIAPGNSYDYLYGWWGALAKSFSSEGLKLNFLSCHPFYDSMTGTASGIFNELAQNYPGLGLTEKWVTEYPGYDDSSALMVKYFSLFHNYGWDRAARSYLWDMAGNYGIIAPNGKAKMNYWPHKLYSLMSGKLVTASSDSGDSLPVLAARDDGKSEVRILLGNYNTTATTVNVNLNNLPFSNPNETLRYDLLKNTTSTYSALAGFRSTQGVNQWSYQKWDGSSYTDLPWSSSDGCWKGTDEWCRVYSDSLHAGASDAVRKWTSPKPGHIKIEGYIKKGSSQGNGIVASILHNQTTVWSQTVNGNDTGSYSYSIECDVSAGDSIYFRLNSRGDSSFDLVYFNPSLKFYESYQASREFGSIQGYRSWSYLRNTSTNYENLTWESANNRWSGNGSLITGNSQTPSSDDSIRRWTAPRIGKIKIKGSANKAAAGGDGVNIKVLRYGSYPIYEYSIAANDTSGHSQDIDILEIAAGETIDFVVCGSSNTTSDQVIWNPDIQYQYQDPTGIYGLIQNTSNISGSSSITIPDLTLEPDQVACLVVRPANTSSVPDQFMISYPAISQKGMASEDQSSQVFVRKTPIIDWFPCFNATSYEIEIDDNSSFSSPEISVSGILDNRYQVTAPLIDEKKYWVRVWAVNSSGRTLASNSGEFNMTVIDDAHPGGWNYRSTEIALEEDWTGGFHVYKPSFGAVGEQLRPRFEWTKPDGASNYRLRISTNSDLSQPVIDVWVGNVSGYTITSDLSATTTYYYGVTASDGTNTTEAPESGRSFKTGNPNASFAADEFSSGTLGAQWSFVRQDKSLWSLDDEPGYIQLSMIGDIVNTIEGVGNTFNSTRNILLQNAPGNDYTITTALKMEGAAGDLSHRGGLIAYQDDDNFIAVFRGWTSGGRKMIAVKEINGVTSTVTANDTEAQGRPVALKIVKSGTSYTLYFSHSSSWTQLTSFTGVSLSSPKVGLLSTQSYQSAMSVNYDYFHSSAEESAPGSFTLSEPSNAARNVTQMPLLKWTEATNALRYNVQVSATSDFASTIVNTTVGSNAYGIESKLDPDSTYYWRVTAINPNGTTVSGSTFSFTTGRDNVYYQASSGYSSTQGSNQWYYQQWDGSSYSNLTWDGTNGYWVGTHNWCRVYDTAQCPGDVDSVRKWVASEDGAVRIKGSIKKTQSGGNGIVATILKNGAVLWSKTISGNDTGIYNYDIPASVLGDDVVYFRLSAIGDSSYDFVSWNPLIEFLPNPSVQASTAFSSTQGERNWYYQQWNGSTYSNLTWDGVNGYWVGTHPWIRIYDTAQCPGDEDSVRKWVAVIDGTARIKGSIQKIQSGGNGVVATIVQNGNTVWSKTIDGTDVSSYTYDIPLSVYSGDAVYFILNARGDCSFDFVDWNPEIHVSRAITYKASSGFSSYQTNVSQNTIGLNQWSYLQWDGSSYSPLKWSHSNSFWEGTHVWSRIYSNALCPGDKDVARSWTAPQDGTIRIEGFVRKMESGGNGEEAKILLNSTQLWSYTVSSTDTSNHSINITQNVKKGDMIYFRLGAQGDCSFDMTEWDPAVVFIPSAIYNVDDGFSGVQGTDNWFYQQWNGSVYSDLTWDSSNNYWVGTHAWCRVYDTAQCPGDVDSVRKWIAPVSGTVYIKGLVQKTQIGGNGVSATILNNTQSLWSRTISLNDTAEHPYDISVNVNTGDTIYFRLSADGDSSFDFAAWNPTIFLAPSR